MPDEARTLFAVRSPFPLRPEARDPAAGRARSSRDDLERLAARADAVGAAAADGRPSAARHALQRAIVDGPPPVAEVRAWWAQLAEAERRRLEEDASLAVGNLDGLPWPARIRANHLALGRILDGREPAGLAGFGARSSRLRGDEARDARIRERLGLLQSGAGFFVRDGAFPRFLLAFDPERSALAEYLGPAIRETDDPYASPLADGVRALGVFVPGNDSDVLQFEGKGHTMSEPVILANDAAGGVVAGMIAWQGGPFPVGLSVLRADPALLLARRLAPFVNAIPRDARVRVTAFGFSFGGAVVGLALRDGMRVDRVAHLASAGLGHGIRSLEDLPPAARVPHYAMLAPGDATVGPAQGLEARLPWLGRIGHGASPIGTPGVTRLETGWLDDAARSGPLLTGHMPLLERWGTTAKRNMATVLAGGEADEAAPRGLGERLAQRIGLAWSPLRRAEGTRRPVAIPE